MPKAIKLPGYRSLGEFSRTWNLTLGKVRNDLDKGFCAYPRKSSPGQGHEGHSHWNCYQAMMQRCYQPNVKRFKFYGGRGIKVCGAWFYSFDQFVKDVGPRPSNKHSIDRIDNNGNYEPGNVRWATYTEQNNNRSYFKGHKATSRSRLQELHITERPTGTFRVRFTSPIVLSRSFSSLKDAIEWRDEQLIGIRFLLEKKNAS